jgi:hypothetical protein
MHGKRGLSNGMGRKVYCEKERAIAAYIVARIVKTLFRVMDRGYSAPTLFNGGLLLRSQAAVT